MESKDYGNGYYQSAKYSLNRKRQVINETLRELQEMQFEMIEDTVLAKEYQGFPEANDLIKYIKEKNG